MQNKQVFFTFINSSLYFLVSALPVSDTFFPWEKNNFLFLSYRFSKENWRLIKSYSNRIQWAREFSVYKRDRTRLNRIFFLCNYRWYAPRVPTHKSEIISITQQSPHVHTYWCASLLQMLQFACPSQCNVPACHGRQPVPDRQRTKSKVIYPSCAIIT